MTFTEAELEYAYTRGVRDGATRTAQVFKAMLEGFIEAGVKEAQKEENAPRVD